MEIGEALKIAARQISAAMTVVPLTPDDEACLEKIRVDSKIELEEDLAGVVALRGAVSPGVWAVLIRKLTRAWTPTDQLHACGLPATRKDYPSSGDFEENALIDSATVALYALAWAGLDDSGTVSSPGNITESFHCLAHAVEHAGTADIAYNLVIAGLNLGASAGVGAEMLARYGIELGLAAKRPHQVAGCSMALARAATLAADRDEFRRIEAFECCEAAIERLAACSPDLVHKLSAHLRHILAERPYLADLRQSITKRLNGHRISHVPQRQWRTDLPRDIGGEVNFATDATHLELRGPSDSRRAKVDWMLWKLDHPAFRHAVPQHQSFLREADFDGRLLELAHEITHALSLYGHVGVALTFLRLALLECEIRQWSGVAHVDDQVLLARIAHQGVAPLVEGEFSQLLNAERSLELTLKARILQDVWTPWFEGLALFTESTLANALEADAMGILPHACLNLVDFIQGAEGTSVATDDRQRFNAELVERFKQAARERAPDRLLHAFRFEKAPYFAGYLAVRSVVARWRATMGRKITGAEACRLLLHATRYATWPHIPDLSRSSWEFAAAALSAMVAWAERLGGLSKAELESYVTPADPGDPAALFRWEDMRLVRSSAKDLEQVSIVPTERLREALLSLGRYEDENRVVDASPFTRELVGHSSRIIRELWQDGDTNKLAVYANELFLRGTLLPVGRADARFHLNVDDESDSAGLALALRTTEAHVEGGPSFNAFSMALAQEEATELAEAYRQLGRPRMTVHRLIDLGGIHGAEHRFPGWHFLALHYGDWFRVCGTTPAADHHLASDPAHRENLRSSAYARLCPNPIAQAEEEVISSGDRGAERIRDWIDRTSGWRIGDNAIEDTSWPTHVKTLALEVLSGESRLERQRSAARALLTLLLADAPLAAEAAEDGFEAMSWDASAYRRDIVEALTRSGEGAGSEPDLAELIKNATLAARIFRHFAHGWDVVTPDP